MRYLAVFPFAILAVPAQAHTGHLADVAGHDHWVAGAAIGIAIAVGVWGALKGKRSGEATENADGDGEADQDEVPA